MTDGAGRDLLRGANHELIASDFTQLRVFLHEPLPPTASIDLTLSFTSQLPEIVARSGYAGEFHMLGQWYPKLAKLEPDGHFASFPYHGLGEFYADFADYDLEIAVPARFQVAASGVRVSSVRHGARRIERFQVRHVHDIAWAAYPYFITHKFEHANVRFALFAPRGYQAAIARQARVLRAALPYFEQRYGAYPYAQLSVIIPPSNARRAAGMEYPTLFTSAGSFWALPAWLPDPQHDVVAVHEFAHQWFSGMIATDEVSYPMLDEGLAQWASLDFLRHYYATPPSVLARHRPALGLFDFVRAMYMRAASEVPSSLLPVTSYRSETLPYAVYLRPGLVFEAVAERFGRDKLRSALASYARSQRFAHPRPADLFAAFDQAFGAGFSARILQPALEGAEPTQLRRKLATPAMTLDATSLAAELVLLIQAALSWLAA